MSSFKGIKIEYHVLQSFPVTCLNRDDVGAPKTCVVGGVERGRVSSQCWKRQIRLAMRDLDVRIAIRTKQLANLVASKCKKAMTDEKRDYIEKVAGVLTDDTLFFISDQEISALVDFVEMDEEYDAHLKKKTEFEKGVKKAIKDVGITGRSDLDGLDIALFGRMVANAAELNVEAAASFSHAITTHKISSGVDYFTAVDDFTDDDSSGAAHIGASEYSSGTYYRYICLDLGKLAESFDDDELVTAVLAFTKALYIAVPAARQTTFAGYSPWDYAHIYIRKGQNCQLSFEQPVKSKGNGYLIPSIEAMDDGLARQEKLMGSMFGKIDEIIYGKDDSVSIDDVCSRLQSDIAKLNKEA